jgi:hypothetical protein
MIFSIKSNPHKFPLLTQSKDELEIITFNSSGEKPHIFKITIIYPPKDGLLTVFYNS